MRVAWVGGGGLMAIRAGGVLVLYVFVLGVSNLGAVVCGQWSE